MTRASRDHGTEEVASRTRLVHRSRDRQATLSSYSEVLGSQVAAMIENDSPRASALRWPTISEFLRLQCPICWGGAMFRHPLGMKSACDHCHYKYDRGHGYFLGAMFASYTIVVIIEAMIVSGLRLAGLDWTTSLIICALSVLIVGPLVAFPYSRILWVMVERRLLRWGEDADDSLRAELERRRRARDDDSTESDD